MVALYVGGQKVGNVTDFPALLPRFVAEKSEVELREENGAKLGTFTPEPICPWEPDLTEEEIDRRCSKPGRSTADVLARLEALQ